MKQIIIFLRKSRLFYRLFIAFLLLSILPTIFLNVIWFGHFKSDILDLSSRLTTAITANATTILSKQLDTYELISQDIYSDIEIINLLKDCNSLYLAMDFMPEKSYLYEEYKQLIGQKLHQLTKDNSYISNIQIVTSYDQFSRVDPYGNQTGGVIRNFEQFLASPYYQEALSAKGYPLWFDTTSVHNIFYRNNNASYGIADTLTLSRAILNPYTNNTLGVIVMNINKTFLHNLFLDFPLATQSNLLIMNDGDIITSLMHSPGAPLIPHDMDFTPNIINNESGSFTQFIGNQYCFVNYQKLSHNNFYLVNVMNYSLLIEKAITVFVRILVLSIIWLILSAVIAYVITSSVTQPINRLKATMSHISLDDLNVNHSIIGDDEIGTLGKQFNKMIDNLKFLINKAYISELKEKELSFKHKNAQLNALQMQINPHFLYNTLDIIRWEAMYEANGENKVTHMIEDFSRLLRLGTKNNLDLVPLQEELSHIKAYLKVINYKFEVPIKLQLHYDFREQDYLMPKLILQPLIENAVVHGFEGYDGEKIISICIVLNSSHMIFNIANTGRSILAEDLDFINHHLKDHLFSNESIGLYNVNDRLQLYFDHDYELSFDAHTEFATSIHLSIPLCTQKN